MSYYDEEPEYLCQEDVEEIQEEYRKTRLLEALVGPSVSTGFHIVLVVLLAFLIQDQFEAEKQDIKVVLKPEDPVKIPPKPPEKEIEQPEVEVKTTDPVSVPILDAELDEKAIEESEKDIPTTNDNLQNDDLSEIIVSPSPFTSRHVTGGNSSGGIKGKFRQHGVDPEGYVIFKRSLAWLAKVQNPDGSWGSDGEAGYTGLALLTFLAHGETPISKKYGNTVKKAMKWLLEDKIDVKSHHAYPHAIKTYALAEAYAMTNMSLLEDKMNECVEVIIKGQQEGGAFDYNYKTNENRQDLSFSGWNYQALKAADLAGCSVDGLHEAIYKSIEYLKLMGGSKKSYAYTTSQNDPNSGRGSGKWTMKAVGTLCLQLLEPGKHDILTDELDSMLKEGLARFNWDKAPKRSLYGWYYETNAMFHAQGKYWDAWKKKFVKELKKSQHAEGYWVYPGNNHMPGDELSKKVYATTLSALMLSVPFRYLPSSQIVKPKKPKEAKKQEPKDLDEGLDLVE